MKFFSNRRRSEYDLPHSAVLLLIAITAYWLPPKNDGWLLFALSIAHTVCAAVHDYKVDGYLRDNTIFWMVLDTLLIGLLCFLFFR